MEASLLHGFEISLIQYFFFWPAPLQKPQKVHTPKPHFEKQLIKKRIKVEFSYKLLCLFS